MYDFADFAKAAMTNGGSTEATDRQLNNAGKRLVFVASHDEAEALAASPTSEDLIHNAIVVQNFGSKRRNFAGYALQKLRGLFSLDKAYPDLPVGAIITVKAVIVPATIAIDEPDGTQSFDLVMPD